MAEKKPSGFRFRLPWLLQHAPPRAREPPTQSPHTTTQISVASTPAQKPPFRPPGKAPAPPPAAPAAAPPTVPAPFSPRLSPPQSVASPPPSVSPKSTVPKTPTAKTIEPVATHHTKETQTTTVTAVPATPPQTPPLSPPRQAQSQPSPTQTPSPPPSVSPRSSVLKSPTAKTTKGTQPITETIHTTVTADPETPPLSPPPSVSPNSSVPKSTIAKTTESVAAQPAKETQTSTETTQTIETADPATPLLSLPASVSRRSSVPKSPTAKTTKSVAGQPTNETQSTTETIQTTENADPAPPPRSPPLSTLKQAQSQPSPTQTRPPPPVSPNSLEPESPAATTTKPVAAQPAKETQTTTETIPTNETVGPPTQAQSQPSPPPAKQSPTRTPPRSPPRLASEPTDAKSTSEVSEIKKSTMYSDYIPQGNHLALDEKPREMTETVSMDSHSMEAKSQQPKLITAIKDNFVHQIETKESMDEKPASVITIAGDNTGALMNLCLDEIRGGHKLTTDHHDTAVNGSSREDGENQEPKAIVNSNIQGINNSMMFDSSVTERNPGVHLGFYLNLTNIDNSVVKNTESTEMQRVEANITPPQKLVYNPAMGRSPGGVFTEPSECEFEEDDPQTSGESYEIEVL